MAKRIKYPKISHDMPNKLTTRMALLPIGMFLHRDIQQANAGDIVEFWDDWRHERAILERKCIMPINSAIFAYLVKLIYGQCMTTKKILERWKSQSIIQGYGESGLDSEECLLIEVKEIESSGI